MILCLGLMMAYGCSTTRHLGNNQYLYKKSTIVVDADKASAKKLDTDALSQYIVPEANRKFLNLFPLKLWMYNLAGDSVPSKGFRHWLKTKAGEPPVLYKAYQVEASKNELNGALNNLGFFHHHLESEVKKKRKKAYVFYHIQPKSAFAIDTLLYPKVSDSLSHYIHQYADNSLIRSGKDYNLDRLKAERSRLSTLLKNEGFFYMSPNYLQYVADTLHTDGDSVRLIMNYKPGMPDYSRLIYKVGKVVVYHDYAEDNQQAYETIQEEGLYHVYDQKTIVKPKVLSRSVFLNTGDIYREENYKLTLQKLSNLNVFKFVNIRFEKDTASIEPTVNVNIYLQSALPKSVSAEVQAVSKSNDYVGPGLTLSYNERNIGRSATSLQLSLNSSFETQLTNSKSGVNTIEIGANAQFTIPKLIVPFVDGYRIIGKRYSPKTIISGGYSYWTMSDLFDFKSMDLSFGYDWRETQTKQHKLDLLSLSYTYIHPKADWEDIYAYVDESLEEQFILGLKYTFTYNDQNIKPYFINTYFSGSAEFAGNTIALGEAIFSPDTYRSGEPSEIFNAAYAEYTRLYSEVRFYHKFSSYDKLVARLAAGVGIPYGNSVAMPYNKQFFTGGASSIRAFRSRSLGPGAYNPPDSLTHDAGIEQAGDIKLEANIEYRFNLVSYLKGALFLDAGNVWLLDADADIPDGEFQTSSFMKQIAVGSGVGFRIDASFLVLRLDIGFPLRKPYPTNGDYWLIKDIDFGSSTWRKDNLVYNIAFGYPF